LHKIVGHQMSLVTRASHGGRGRPGDQKRVMTPGGDRGGADLSGVGRPITEAADPKAAADAIQVEIARALG